MSQRRICSRVVRRQIKEIKSRLASEKLSLVDRHNLKQLVRFFERAMQS